MGLADLTDRLFLGGSPKPDINRLANLMGGDLFKSGVGITDQSLADMRDLAKNFQSQIDNGGLTPALRRGYSVARGGISDNTVRFGRSFQQKVAQVAAQNGGSLTPAAIAQLTAENSQANAESAFSATNAINMDEAHVAQASTETLQGRIMALIDSANKTGLSREQLGELAQYGAASLKLNRNKAINDALRSWAGLFMGGMGGH